jgi:ubiquinone/menaquinone biosynthesis C-methylase UbiE
MKLNLGCGNKRKQGFVGVDFAPCDAADILADLTGTLPFTDSSIDEIWLDNVIEHIQDIPQLMRELHRICRDGAIITLITPHFASADSWRGPTHVPYLSFFSMDHFQRQGVAHYTGGAFLLSAASSALAALWATSVV